MRTTTSVPAMLACLFALAGCGSHPITWVDENWPVTDGNAGRTRQGVALPLQDVPRLNWTKTVIASEGGAICAAVATADRLYIAASPLSGCGRTLQGASLTCLRLSDGTLLWRNEIPQAHAYGAEMFIDGDRLYVARYGGQVTALDAFSGKEVWRQDDQAFMYPSSILADAERLYVASRIHSSQCQAVYAYRKEDGKPLWSAKPCARTDYDLPTFMALAEGLLLVAGQDKNVYALCPDDGSIEWEEEVPRVRPMGAHLAGGMVVTANGLRIQSAARGAYMSSYDYLVVSDLRTRHTRWKATLPRVWSTLSPHPQDDMATDGSRLVFNRVDGEVRCLDLTTGWLLWKTDICKKVDPYTRVCAPVISGDVVLVASHEGRLYGLSLGSGKILWKVVLEPTSEKPESEVSTYRILVADQSVLVCGHGTVWSLVPAAR